MTSLRSASAPDRDTLARAAATDAANRHMIAHGRRYWDRSDSALAATVLAALSPPLEPENG